jgi:CRP/FNR family transcriptional regulator
MIPFLRFLPSKLQEAIAEHGQLMEFEEGVEIIREGQYIKVIPIVLEGAVKVISRYEEKDLLLYYIQARESCIMSLTAIMEKSPSKIHAITEAPTQVVLIPARLVEDWLKTYPTFRQLFFQQFYQRYDDLLQTIQQLLFEKIDRRLLKYLKDKSALHQTRHLKLSHRQIAEDLGSAREVISRAMKKLENEGLVRQVGQGEIVLLLK